MIAADWLAIAALLLCALAILPGTLGVLMFTNKIAASASGARYIYGKSLWVLIASAALLIAAVAQGVRAGAFAWGTESFSWVLAAACLLYAGILLFGFFMHTKLMFRPVRKPKFISLDEAIEKFGPEEEVVGVIDPKGQPYAFIARLARRPHIVYQPEGEAPFIMTHCILAHSSMSYAMKDRFQQPDITITAALANNMVFYEKSNQCSIIQMHNESRDGDLPLDTVPTVMCSLKTWKELYPESKVWIRNIEWRDIFYLKLLARADVIDPSSPVMVYPLQHETDERLPLKSQVIGVFTGGQSRAYPTELFKDRQLIQDEVGGTPILLASAVGGDFIQVYDRRVDGRTLTFTPGEGDNIVDDETGSEWTPRGECVGGELEGKSLEPVPHYNKIFWYVWADFHPGTEIYGRAAQEQAAE